MAKALKNLFSDYGYNLVALPKEDINPLLLLYKNDNAVSSVESPIQDLFVIGDSPPPTILRDKSVTSIEGSAAVVFDAEAGVNMLGWLLQKLNMGKLSGKLNIDSTNTVKISYENIVEDKVSLLELDNFITDSMPNIEHFKTFESKLFNSELYVVNAVLKSNSFSIIVESKSGQEVNIETTVKGIIDANTDIKRNKDNCIVLTQTGTKPIIFAFKAQRIIYDEKKWWQFFKKEEAAFHIKDQQGVIFKSESDFPTKALLSDSELISI